jgi:hypothetical protein
MLNCYCEDAFVTTLTNEWRCARKEHRCEECGKTIRTGERYHYESFVQEGDLVISKICEHCNDLWLNLQALGYCRYSGGVLFECLSEYYEEVTHYDEDAEEFLLDNGRTVSKQINYLANKSRSL